MIRSSVETILPTLLSPSENSRPEAGCATSHVAADGLSGDLDSKALETNFEYLALASLAIAKRFNNQATMWTFAPGMTAHALHVAVEFVHPVIVGKKALPALALSSDDPIGELRQFSKSGDIFVGIGAGDDPALMKAMNRAPVYGLTSIWIAAGKRPELGSADYVIWLDEEPYVAGFVGHFVMIYHLLWELTHVCFEHPGLLKINPAVCEGPTCITCSDQGMVMEIIEDLGLSQARARSSQGIEVVDTTLVGEVHKGDLVLIHGQSAITLLEQT